MKVGEIWESNREGKRIRLTRIFIRESSVFGKDYVSYEHMEEPPYMCSKNGDMPAKILISLYSKVYE